MSHARLHKSGAGDSEIDHDTGGWKDILAGGISGGVTRMLIAPLDVIKIRFQVQSNPSAKSAMPPSKYHYTGVVDSVRTILKTEGVLAFWNGNLLAELLYIAYVGAQFGAYSVVQDRLRELVPEHKRAAMQSQIAFASGGLAALIAITATYPLDLLRTRFAAQSFPKTYHTIPQAVQLIYESHGLRGFYSGWGPTSLSIVPSMALQFALYDWAKRSWFGGRESHNPLVHALGGAVSGIVSKLAVLPLDVLKKHMQIQGLYHHANLNNGSTNAANAHNGATTPPSAANTAPSARTIGPDSLWQATRSLYRVEGFRGFFRGAVPSALKAGVSASLTFTCYEQSKVLILAAMKKFN